MNQIDAALVSAIERSGKTASAIARDLNDQPCKRTILNLLDGVGHPTTDTAWRLAEYFGLELRKKVGDHVELQGRKR